MEEVSLTLSPRDAANSAVVKREAARRLRISPEAISDFRIVRRSVDARRKPVRVNLSVMVAVGKDGKVTPAVTPLDLNPVGKDAPVVVIVGAGPAGLFAALEAIRLGMRPILLERGKDVETRRKDLAQLCRSGEVDPDSNYCFGEGGAGAFSDGKLFTRSKKRGDVGEVLRLLVQHGANPDILVDAHPHIGSDRLPGIISNIRKNIIAAGGEVYFETRVADILIEDERCVGVVTSSGREFRGDGVILATGHSARDIYRMLKHHEVKLEAKGFAMGVRLEHPQHLIDQLQYHSQEGRGKWLPAAAYSFVSQVDGRGVYSFCMCPGGVVVPAASSPGESVVNGMSASARASRWANSGMVVEIRPGDIDGAGNGDEFDLLDFQEKLEKEFYKKAGGSINAPAQRMTDFVIGRSSTDLPQCSYPAGVHPDRLDLLLPPFIADRLKKGFKDFDRKCKGFLTDEAVLIGLESRTSSPIRVPRDPQTLEQLQLQGLYPAGEGAGYAGGIVSAALDGMRGVKALSEKIMNNYK